MTGSGPRETFPRSAFLTQRSGQLPGLLWLVLLFALMVRLPLLTHPGCQCDVRPFAVWGWLTSEGGVAAAYERGADYPPVYLYALGALATVGRALDLPAPTLREDPAPGVIALFKLPALVSDLLLGLAVYWAARPWTSRAAIAVGFVTLNPALIYASVLWGQIDPLPALGMVVSLAAALGSRFGVSGAAWMTAALIKAQSLVVLPTLALAFLGKGKTALTHAALAAAAAAVLIIAPALLGGGQEGVARAYLHATERFPTITMNAYNGWYLWTLGKGNWTGNPSAETSDSQLLLGPLSYRDVGFAFLAIWALLVLILQRRRTEPWAPWVGAAAIAVGFFCLPTQIHERYLYPALVFLGVVAWADPRLRQLLGLLSVTFLLNLALVWPATPALDALAHQVGDWLRFAIAALNLAGMVGLAGWLAFAPARAVR